MKRTRQTGGFSLVEVMCAIVIMGIGLAGLTHGVTAALSSSKESELQTTAALLAAGRIETIRAEGYLHDGDEDGDFGKGLDLYRWKQTISAASVDGLHEVEVTIENAKTGQAIYELKTMLFDATSTSTDESSRSKNSDKPKKKNGKKR